MATTQVIGEASYVDARPDGQYAALVPGIGIRTRNTVLPLPGGEDLLFIRVTPAGAFEISGQGQRTGHAWLYTNGAWVDRGVSCGVSPVIFDYNANLSVSDCSRGSQGFRYIDVATGRIVSGDESYGPRFGLSEYTDLGQGLFIGQGHDVSGVCVWDGTILRRLDSGICRFVRALNIGGQVSVAYWAAPAGATLHWLSLDELRALPPVTTVPPPPPPPPPPPTMPEIPAAEVTRAQTMLATVRTETGFGAGQDDLPYTKLVAQRLGGRWGLNGKRGDANTPSHDVLAWKIDGAQPILVDILGDGGGANTPSWQVLEYPQPAGAVWIDPGVPPTGPPPPSGATTPGAQIDAEITGLLKRLAAAETKIATLEAKPSGGSFSPSQLNGIKVSLKTDNGHFVCAEDGGSGVVNATRDSAGGWESFELGVR